MKKVTLLSLLLLMSLFVSCSGGDGGSSNTIPDLIGEWKQNNSNSDDSYQVATITDGIIEIFWYTKSTETKSLYWSGSFTAPSATGDYSWDSTNNKEKTSSALLASGDDTKTFTYSSGELSYSVSVLGSTQTVKLKKLN